MSNVKSVRLTEDLEEPVEQMPRGAFTFVVIRLLQLYFFDNEIRAKIDAMSFIPTVGITREPVESKVSPELVTIGEQDVNQTTDPIIGRDETDEMITEVRGHGEGKNIVITGMEQTLTPPERPLEKVVEKPVQKAPPPVEKVEEPKAYSILDSILPN